MLTLITIVLAAWIALGLCWHLANGGSLYAKRSERRRWQRVAEEARAKQRTYGPVREASPVRRVEPAPEPWLTADELVDLARDQTEQDVAGLRAGVDGMMGRLGRDRQP